MLDSDYELVLYETLDEGRIVRIKLNRPEARNAQNRGMLVELNEAFLRAGADDEVRVVILGEQGLPAHRSRSEEPGRGRTSCRCDMTTLIRFRRSRQGG